MREKITKIIFQPRVSRRNYIYDYVATVKGKNILKSKKGCGVSVNKTIARNRACFEAIERYLVAKISKNRLVKFSIDELKNEKEYYLDPNEIIQESSGINPREKIDHITDSKKIAWVRGSSLTRNCPIWVPAFAVFSDYKSEDGKRFFRATSCGVSIHKTRTKAIIHGILELIERDAALLAWFTKKQLTLIDLSEIKDKKLRRIIDNINFEKKDVKVFLTTTDIRIPSVFAIISNHLNNYPAVAFGLSAELNLEKAILKSIEEALMILNTEELIGETIKNEVKKNEIKNLIDHILYYAFPKNKDAWQFLLKYKPLPISKINIKYKFIRNYSVTHLIRYLANKGIELIIFNFFDRFLKDNNLYMTRVFARGLCPMFVGSIPPPAIETIIRKRGKIKRSYKLNTDPHPFG
jgi:ribosomal protein S12 methylthiotransferase accessory factor